MIVEVFSTINADVRIILPDLHLNCVWSKKNTKQLIDFEVLLEALADDGIKSLFTNGILFIKDVNIKTALKLDSN